MKMITYPTHAFRLPVVTLTGLPANERGEPCKPEEQHHQEWDFVRWLDEVILNHETFRTGPGLRRSARILQIARQAREGEIGPSFTLDDDDHAALANAMDNWPEPFPAWMRKAAPYFEAIASATDAKPMPQVGGGSGI